MSLFLWHFTTTRKGGAARRQDQFYHNWNSNDRMHLHWNSEALSTIIIKTGNNAPDVPSASTELNHTFPFAFGSKCVNFIINGGLFVYAFYSRHFYNNITEWYTWCRVCMTHYLAVILRDCKFFTVTIANCSYKIFGGVAIPSNPRGTVEIRLDFASMIISFFLPLSIKCIYVRYIFLLMERISLLELGWIPLN